MKIYHGSDHIVEKPVYHYGNKHNDYGYGFYCTEYRELGMEWASSPVSNGYLNSYKLDTDGLVTLNLNRYGILTWLSVLLQNRTFTIASPLAIEARSYITSEFSVDIDTPDLIIGYRADDSYFSFAMDFINGTISVAQLSEAMRLGNLGNQIVIKSKKAFSRISFKDAESVDSRIWYPKRAARDEQARRSYFSMDKKYVRGDIYITRILDEEMKKDDPRLQ